MQTNLEWVLGKEFGGQRGYGRDAIPSYENSHGLHGCAQIRRQNAAKPSVCICAICGRLLPARRFCGFCVFRGRFLSEAMLVQRRPLHPKKNIATLQQQDCHATTTRLPRYDNKVATLLQNVEKRMEDETEDKLGDELEDRLEDNPYCLGIFQSLLH